MTGTPTFDAGTATCDNFALEYHLRIGFGAVDGGFKIKEAFVDVIYGKVAPSDPGVLTEEFSISRRTSVSFYED